MSFFSSTDTGTTINRFSQDLMLIDMELPLTALNTVASMSSAFHKPMFPTRTDSDKLSFSALRR